MKMKTRILSMLLALVMCLSVLPGAALSAEEGPVLKFYMSVQVEGTGPAVPGEETFQVELRELTGGSAEASGVTAVADTVTTDGEGYFDGIFTATLAPELINANNGWTPEEDSLVKDFVVTQRSGGAEGWTYDEHMYMIRAVYTPGNTEIWAYVNEMDGSPMNGAFFMNTYSGSDPSDEQDSDGELNAVVVIRKWVEIEGEGEPGREIFSFDVAPYGNAEADISNLRFSSLNMVVDGEGDHELEVEVTGPVKELRDAGGLLITERDTGAAGWSYDPAQYVLDFVAEAGDPTTANVSYTYYAVVRELVEGIDEPVPANGLYFRNTYNAEKAAAESPDPMPPVEPVPPPAPGVEISQTVTVTPDLSGGSSGPDGASIITVTASVGEEIDLSKLDTPERSGYDFTGWYTDKGCTVKAEDSLIPEDGATLYAGWSFHGALNAKDHVGYVNGFPDGTVGPLKNISRSEVAAMLYRLLTPARREEITTTASAFSDLTGGEWYFREACSMAKGGYITGFPDGTFGGGKEITQAEFVTMLVRFLGGTSGKADFPDVPETYWAYPYIATASSVGWVNGLGDGTFGPTKNLTRAEAMTIINRVLNRGVDKDSTLLNFKLWPDNDTGAWYYYDVIEATNGHDYLGTRPSEQWTALH